MKNLPQYKYPFLIAAFGAICGIVGNKLVLTKGKLISITNIVFFVIFIGACSAIAYLTVKYKKKREEDSRKKTRMEALYFQSKNILEEQETIINQFYKNDNYFKLLLSSLRTNTELRKFKEINKSHSGNWVISSLPMWDYFISIFRALMSGLTTGDEYLTLSIVDFWSKDKNPETIAVERGIKNNSLNQNFFETNFSKCIHGNIVSKRIIIVNLTRLKKGTKKNASSSDKKYSSDFDKILTGYKDEGFQHENFENNFYLVDESEYNELIKEDVPFALIRRKNYNLESQSYYQDKLCVSTYIPNLHTKVDDIDSKNGWRNGGIPKIGIHIAPNNNDSTWIRLHSKFDNIHNNKNIRKGLFFSPKELDRK